MILRMRSLVPHPAGAASATRGSIVFHPLLIECCNDEFSQRKPSSAWKYQPRARKRQNGSLGNSSKTYVLTNNRYAGTGKQLASSGADNPPPTMAEARAPATRPSGACLEPRAAPGLLPHAHARARRRAGARRAQRPGHEQHEPAVRGRGQLHGPVLALRPVEGDGKTYPASATTSRARASRSTRTPTRTSRSWTAATIRASIGPLASWAPRRRRRVTPGRSSAESSAASWAWR